MGSSHWSATGWIRHPGAPAAEGKLREGKGREERAQEGEEAVMIAFLSSITIGHHYHMSEDAVMGTGGMAATGSQRQWRLLPSESPQRDDTGLES